MNNTPAFPLGTPVVILEAPGTNPTLKGKTGYIRGVRFVEGAQREEEPRYLVANNESGADLGWWTEASHGGLTSLAQFRADTIAAERERVRAIPQAIPPTREAAFVPG